MVEDVVDDGVDVGNVDLAVAVDVGWVGPVNVAVAGRMAVSAATAVDDDVDHAVGVGNADLAISIHISRWSFRD